MKLHRIVVLLRLMVVIAAGIQSAQRAPDGKVSPTAMQANPNRTPEARELLQENHRRPTVDGGGGDPAISQWRGHRTDVAHG